MITGKSILKAIPSTRMAACKKFRWERGQIRHRIQSQCSIASKERCRRDGLRRDGNSSTGTGSKRVLFVNVKGKFVNDMRASDLWVNTPSGWRLKSRLLLQDDSHVSACQISHFQSPMEYLIPRAKASVAARSELAPMAPTGHPCRGCATAAAETAAATGATEPTTAASATETAAATSATEAATSACIAAESTCAAPKRLHPTAGPLETASAERPHATTAAKGAHSAAIAAKAATATAAATETAVASRR